MASRVHQLILAWTKKKENHSISPTHVHFFNGAVNVSVSDVSALLLYTNSACITLPAKVYMCAGQTVGLALCMLSKGKGEDHSRGLGWVWRTILGGAALQPSQWTVFPMHCKHSLDMWSSQQADAWDMHDA